MNPWIFVSIGLYLMGCIVMDLLFRVSAFHPRFTEIYEGMMRDGNLSTLHFLAVMLWPVMCLWIMIRGVFSSGTPD